MHRHLMLQDFGEDAAVNVNIWLTPDHARQKGTTHVELLVQHSSEPFALQVAGLKSTGDWCCLEKGLFQR